VGEHRRYHSRLCGKPTAGGLSRQGGGTALRGSRTSVAQQPQLRRTPFGRSSQGSTSRHSGEAFSTVGHPPKLGHIGQTVNARGSAYATCCALQPLVARQCKGRGFGIESAAAKPSIIPLGPFIFLRDLQEKREPTSGLEPLPAQRVTFNATSCKAQFTDPYRRACARSRSRSRQRRR
jgi:hypothetical protein